MIHKGAGEVLNSNSAVTLSNVMITGNSSTGTVGGGISNLGSVSSLNVYHSSIMSNSARYGGAIYNEGSVTINKSLLLDNSATTSGGAFDNRASAIITNSTITGNSSSGGAGIASSGNLLLDYDTISGNDGSGVKINDNTLTIQNSIIANHPSGGDCEKEPIANLVSKGRNLVDDDSSCPFNPGKDIIDQNAMLNTSLTLIDSLTSYFAFSSPSSPAIDAITEGSLGCPGFDQRGLVRPADGNGNGDNKCDIGSFELNGINPFYIFLPMVAR